MGSTFLHQRCGGMEKNEEELSLWCLEVDSYDNLVVYMDGKEPSDFWAKALSV